MPSVVWSTPAMCMVPSHQTVQENKYITTAGRVKFRVGESGIISFFAPIHTPLPNGLYTLRAHIERIIPDLGQTSIELRRARRVDGAVETILNCISVQAGAAATNVRASDSRSTRVEFDHDDFYYWVQITDRNDTPATQDTVDAVVGVGLILD